MHTRTPKELYRQFLEVVGSESRRERIAVNRRMLGVVLWCLVAPLFVALVGVLLIKFQVVPRRSRGWFDLATLLVPAVYAGRFLVHELLREAPKAMRGGGIANLLGQFASQHEWRDATSELLRSKVGASGQEWAWISTQFSNDLEQLRSRNRYLTALAGAVFFLINQGLDAILEDVPSAGSEPMQWTALGMVLVLLYFSGSQVHDGLKRYLRCAETLAGKTGFSAGAGTGNG